MKAGSATSIVPNPNKAKEVEFKLKLKGEIPELMKRDKDEEMLKVLEQSDPEAAARAKLAMQS